MTRMKAEPVVHIDDERFRVTEWRFATGAETGWHIHAHDYVIVPLVNGRLLLEENGAGRRTLVDAATGRLLTDLGTSMPVSDALGRASPYLIAQTIEPPGRTSVSSFHPRTGELLLRGSITPVLDYGCQHENGLLACATQDNRLAVTAVD